MSNGMYSHKKDSKTNSENYRQISLDSIQGNLMEKIVKKKLLLLTLLFLHFNLAFNEAIPLSLIIYFYTFNE